MKMKTQKATMAAKNAPMNGTQPRGSSATLGFEEKLFKAADTMRNNVEASEYKHVVLGLVFLRYVSGKFESRYVKLAEEYPQGAEDRDEYLSERVFWVPEDARWKHLQANARQPDIGKRINNAMIAIEKDNPLLKGVLPKDYNNPALNKVMLGELVDLISSIDTNGNSAQGKDILGRVYEYFLGGFAGSEGKRGGEFYTPPSIVRVLVEILQPYTGRIYDPCCGSGGIFIQSEKFIETHGGTIDGLSIYGQESNHTTWRLCKMNLAIHSIAGDIRWNNKGSFHKDEHQDSRFDFILANPPFNISDWGGDKLSEDARWVFGVPPDGNANYAWLQHIYSRLNSNGRAGVVLANSSMSSRQAKESDIRKAMIEADVVDCIVTLPGQLFYSTQIPACLWFFAREKKNNKGKRNRQGKVLFIDARSLGTMVDRKRREFADTDIAEISDVYQTWSEGKGYQDKPGFCCSVKLATIRKNDYVLTPGLYVGMGEAEEDNIPFSEKIAVLSTTLESQMREAKKLDTAIRKNLTIVNPKNGK